MASWQAHFSLTPDEVAHVSTLAAVHLTPEDFGLITEVLEDGSDGGTTLALTINADSLGGAINAALAEWTSLRSRGGLPREPSRLEFVVGPLESEILYHETLLLRAATLLSDDHAAYAVVAAQTAFEVYVRGVFSDLLKHAVANHLVAAVQPQSTALRDAAGARLFAALVGQKPTDAGEDWRLYDAHVQRRNRVVHHGAVVDSASSQESISAVRAMIRWIDTAVSVGG